MYKILTNSLRDSITKPEQSAACSQSCVVHPHLLPSSLVVLKPVSDSVVLSSMSAYTFKGWEGRGGGWGPPASAVPPVQTWGPCPVAPCYSCDVGTVCRMRGSALCACSVDPHCLGFVD